MKTMGLTLPSGIRKKRFKERSRLGRGSLATKQKDGQSNSKATNIFLELIKREVKEEFGSSKNRQLFRNMVLF